jgi:hypothetical protein
MQLLTGKEKGKDDGLLLGPRRHTFPLVELSGMLARQQLPWKRWFHKDFPEMIRDVGGEVSVPFWIMQQEKTLEGAPEADERSVRRHYTDENYVLVPWRRFYVWARCLRRMCSKYIGQFILQDAMAANERAIEALRAAGLANVPGIQVFEPAIAQHVNVLSLAEAESVMEMEHPGEFADKYISYEWDEESESDFYKLADHVWPHIAFKEAGAKTGARFKIERLPTSPPFLLWMYLRHVQEYAVGNPLLSLDGFQISQRRFNFVESHAVISYMLWYLSQLKIPAHYASILETSFGGANAQMVNVLDDLHNGHKMIFYVDENGRDRWPVLERLPLAPRRLALDEDTEPQYWSSTLFLGAEAKDDDMCIMCQANVATTQEKNNPALGFCGKDCHRKFRSFFPIGGNEDDDLPHLFDVLYPILLKLEPAALLAVSQASPVARRLYNDERFRQEYFKAHAPQMRETRGAVSVMPTVMVLDWFDLIAGDAETKSIHLTAWARRLIEVHDAPLRERNAPLLARIVAHPKFNASGQFDRLLSLAIGMYNAPAVRVLVASGFRVASAGNPGRNNSPWLRCAIFVGMPGLDVLVELLKSNDPNIVSEGLLDVAVTQLAARVERHNVDPLSRGAFELLVNHPILTAEQRADLHFVFDGRVAY